MSFISTRRSSFSFLAGQRIREVPIPTYYGDEICNVAGLKYAWDVFIATLKARAQELSIFYDRKYDCVPAQAGHEQYEAKTGFENPHSRVIRDIGGGKRVLDLGSAGGCIIETGRADCHPAVDQFPIVEDAGIDLEFIQFDLNDGLPPIELEEYDYVLMLDVIEHLLSPEDFVATSKGPQSLRTTLRSSSVQGT